MTSRRGAEDERAADAERRVAERGDGVAHRVGEGEQKAVVRDLRKLATEERKTIERLADDIARMILTTYKPERVTVTVRKFLIPGVREICFTVTRRT